MFGNNAEQRFMLNNHNKQNLKISSKNFQQKIELFGCLCSSQPDIIEVVIEDEPEI